MKRFTLVLVAVLALVAAPALFAQNPLNTTAPGATQEQRPGQTNNDLPNPGNPQTQQAVPNHQNGTYQEHGTVEGTATESTTGTNDMNSQTGTSTGVTGTTGTSGSSMNSTDTTTTTTTTDTTSTSGSYSGSTGSASLPRTASNLPTVALAGLLALIAAFAIRVYAKRNA